MTIKELSQVYGLNNEIKKYEKRLEQLEQDAMNVSSPAYDGMPHSRNAGNSAEKLVAEIVDLQAIVAAKRIQYIHEQQRLERYIGGIEDTYTRQIFDLRFVELMSWDDVAEAMHMSRDAVKKRCYRYLDSEKEAI